MLDTIDLVLAAVSTGLVAMGTWVLKTANGNRSEIRVINAERTLQHESVTKAVEALKTDMKEDLGEIKTAVHTLAKSVDRHLAFHIRQDEPPETRS